MSYFFDFIVTLADFSFLLSSTHNIVSIPSIPTSVHIPASPCDLASMCYQATIHCAACDITCTVPHSIHNPNNVPPASNPDTTSPPHRTCNTSSIPASAPSNVSVSPPECFSVPKNPQLASCSLPTQM